MYGLNTSDEMGEMWLQVVPRLPQNFDLLRNDYFRKWGLPDTIAQNQALLKRDPNDALARTKLATALILSGYPTWRWGTSAGDRCRPDSVEAHTRRRSPARATTTPPGPGGVGNRPPPRTPTITRPTATWATCC